jgi:hypothetical protein
MNQEILTIIDGADDFTKKVMLTGFLKNCEFWGKKSAERVFEFEEKLNNAIERDMNDDYIHNLTSILDEAIAQRDTLRKLYRAASKAL